MTNNPTPPAEPAPSDPHPNAWTVRDGLGRIIVREGGKLLYEGEEANMPPEVKAAADSCDKDWPDPPSDPTLPERLTIKGRKPGIVHLKGPDQYLIKDGDRITDFHWSIPNKAWFGWMGDNSDSRIPTYAEAREAIYAAADLPKGCMIRNIGGRVVLDVCHDIDSGLEQVAGGYDTAEAAWHAAWEAWDREQATVCPECGGTRQQSENDGRSLRACCCAEQVAPPPPAAKDLSDIEEFNPDYWACFTGDCPHDTQDECWNSLKQDAAELFAELKRRSSAAKLPLGPFAVMAGAPWNVLDSSGCRIALCGGDSNKDWETHGPKIAAAIVKALNDRVGGEVERQLTIRVPAQATGDGQNGPLSVFARGWNGHQKELLKLNPGLKTQSEILGASHNYHGDLEGWKAAIDKAAALERQVVELHNLVGRKESHANISDVFACAVSGIGTLQTDLAEERAAREEAEVRCSKHVETIGTIYQITGHVHDGSEIESAKRLKARVAELEAAITAYFDLPSFTTMNAVKALLTKGKP